MSVASATNSNGKTHSARSNTTQPSEDENGIFRGEFVLIMRYQKSENNVTSTITRQQLIELKLVKFSLFS